MSEKYFDESLLCQRTGYDNELLIEMFEVFKASVPEYFEMMESYLKAEDWKKFSGAAHRAKSSAAIMGMEAIRDELQQLELESEEERNTKTYPKRLEELRENVEIGLKQIEEFISGLPDTD